jgi:hypothetical protein
MSRLSEENHSLFLVMPLYSKWNLKIIMKGKNRIYRIPTGFFTNMILIFRFFYIPFLVVDNGHFLPISRCLYRRKRYRDYQSNIELFKLARNTSNDYISVNPKSSEGKEEGLFPRMIGIILSMIPKINRTKSV